MSIARFPIKLWRIAALASMALGFIALPFVARAQKPRQVDDALLKSGSKTGEEWVSYGVNWSEQRYKIGRAHV